jgi:predicted dehydrogenase
MAKKLLENGFNVICEKPLTTTYAEAEILAKLQEEHQVVFAVTYTYTGYPMVRQMKQMIADGALGAIQKVDLQYYQGWINPVIHDPAQRKTVWRLDPDKGGMSCCIGDIGTHAFDMVEYVTGQQIQQLLADLNYRYPDNAMDVDGTILVRFSEFSKGVLRVSQIATAEENNFTVQIYGEKGGLKWAQENPNYLTFLQEGQPQQTLKPGHDYLSDFAQEAAKLPPGHPEGIFDSMGNIYHGVAKAIRQEEIKEGAYPDISEGVRGMRFIEKVLESHKNGNIWVKL